MTSTVGYTEIPIEICRDDHIGDQQHFLVKTLSECQPLRGKFVLLVSEDRRPHPKRPGAPAEDPEAPAVPLPPSAPDPLAPPLPTAPPAPRLHCSQRPR